MSSVGNRAATLADAIDALKAGELVVYPTETFYALGADASSASALARLAAAKGREAGKPIALIAADAETAFAVAREIPPLASLLADRFWPGPLTLVMPARAGLSAEIIGPDGVGVRLSPHPIATALGKALGRAITATSANLAGDAPPRTLGEARAALGGKVKVFLEGGTLTGGAPSTVVAVTSDGWRIIRDGAITRTQLAAAIGAEALE